MAVLMSVMSDMGGKICSKITFAEFYRIASERSYSLSLLAWTFLVAKFKDQLYYIMG